MEHLEPAAERAEHTCPSCGRPTALTDYGPEPTLCLQCQRQLGVHLIRKAPEPTPDDPRWGVLEAVGLLVASILALLATEVAAVGYILYQGRMGLPVPAGEAIVTDPTLTLVRISASGAAHLVTVALAWYVVTDGARQPFFKSIGWGWRPRYGPTLVLGLLVGIFVANLALAFLFDRLGLTPESTPFDELLKAPSARVAVAIFAVVSAPFVEEVVYRGVLYPALARNVGRVAAILIVSALFLYVHVEQYAGAVVYLVPLGLLSVVLTSLRAYSGSLLPSFALHLLFNAVQVTLILASGGK
jgi:membrane protease YdiL (CAAX protease family)